MVTDNWRSYGSIMKIMEVDAEWRPRVRRRKIVQSDLREHVAYLLHLRGCKFKPQRPIWSPLPVPRPPSAATLRHHAPPPPPAPRAHHHTLLAAALAFTQWHQFPILIRCRTRHRPFAEPPPLEPPIAAPPRPCPSLCRRTNNMIRLCIVPSAADGPRPHHSAHTPAVLTPTCASMPSFPP